MGAFFTLEMEGKMRRHDFVFFAILFTIGFWQNDVFANGLKSACIPGGMKEINGVEACPASCYQFAKVGDKLKFLSMTAYDIPKSRISDFSFTGATVDDNNVVRFASVHVWDESEGCFCFFHCWCNGPHGNWLISVIPYLPSHGVPAIETGCSGYSGKIANWYTYNLHVTGAARDPNEPGKECGFIEPPALGGTQYLSYLDYLIWDWDIPWQKEWSPDINNECNPQPDPKNPNNPPKSKPQWCKDLENCEHGPEQCNYNIALRFYESDEECSGSLKVELGSIIGMGNDPEGSIEISKDSSGIIEFEADSSVHYKILNIKPNSPLAKDWDLDGIVNDDEPFIAFDPNSNDTDEDGILDYDEIKTVFDPDGDHILDFHDNCPNLNNPYQWDNENDGKGDECDLDDDNDGIPDETEIKLGLNPKVDNSNSDSDSDGLLDWDEVTKYKTNPTNPDTDGDGLYDKFEIDYLLDPLDPSDAAEDTDNDGLSNIDEYYLGTHYKKGDTDDDGMPDGWEHKYGLKLTEKDGNVDDDNDGLTNLQEYHKDLNPKNPDSDSDGVLDGNDNCPKNPNSDQSDVNGDGLGDACDMDADSDGFIKGPDCDDTNSKINQNQKEILYDGLDNDCLPQTPDDDFDQDGYNLIDDCNDQLASINPGQNEKLYDGIDNDCNPDTVDCDADSDGYDDCFQWEKCLHIDGISNEFCDCDDNNAQINPSAQEILYNCINDDCDDNTSDSDLDFDGFKKPAEVISGIAYDCKGKVMVYHDCNDSSPIVNPNMQEDCYNNIDDNCNGSVDEDCAEPPIYYSSQDIVDGINMVEDTIIQDAVDGDISDIKGTETIFVEPAYTSYSEESDSGCGVSTSGKSTNFAIFGVMAGLFFMVIRRKHYINF